MAQSILGSAKAALVLRPLPGVPSSSHMQYVEHMLCEAYKISHWEDRMHEHVASESLPSAEYLRLLHLVHPSLGQGCPGVPCQV